MLERQVERSAMTGRLPARDERLWLRYLHGELEESEAASFDRRCVADPQLAAAFERFRHRWESVEPLPTAPVPPGFARRTAARALGTDPQPRPWSMRLAVASTLAAGILVGVGLGFQVDPAARSTADSIEVAEEEPLEWSWSDAESSWEKSSVAEQYWRALAGEQLPTLPAPESDS